MKWIQRLERLERLTDSDYGKEGFGEYSDAVRLAEEWETCAVGEILEMEDGADYKLMGRYPDVAEMGRRFERLVANGEFRKAKVLYHKIKDYVRAEDNTIKYVRTLREKEARREALAQEAAQREAMQAEALEQDDRD